MFLFQMCKTGWITTISFLIFSHFFLLKKIKEKKKEKKEPLHVFYFLKKYIFFVFIWSLHFKILHI